jgi:MFS transporter, putative metabolite:H+ symporter
MSGNPEPHPSDALTAANITRRLEQIPPLSIHSRWATWVGIGCFLDGFTTLTVAAAMTVLVTSLHIDFAKVGLLISAAFFGMFAGAVVCGAASERWGRRAVFAWSVGLFGLLSIVAAFSWNFTSLFWLRVVQGFGLGGAVPVAATLVAECLPASVRGRTFSLNFAVLFALGFVVAPLAGLACIGIFGTELGWRALFGLAGLAFPFGIAVHWLLPESPRWLATQGRLREADAIVQRLEDAARRQGLALATHGPSVTFDERGTRLSEVFVGEYRARTLLVWSLFFTIYFVQYGLNAWLPTLYVKVGGLAPRFALALTVVNGCVTVAAAVLFGLTVDRIGRKRWFVLGFVLSSLGVLWGIIALAVFKFTAWPVLFSTAVFMTAGTGINAGSIYLYAPELFPTRMRSWATSTGSAAGRLGSIVAPTIIGAVLQARLGMVGVFSVLGIMCAAGLITIVSAGIETKQRSLEELAVQQRN